MRHRQREFETSVKDIFGTAVEGLAADLDHTFRDGYAGYALARRKRSVADPRHRIPVHLAGDEQLSAWFLRMPGNGRAAIFQHVFPLAAGICAFFLSIYNGEIIAVFLGISLSKGTCGAANDDILG